MGWAERAQQLVGVARAQLAFRGARVGLQVVVRGPLEVQNPRGISIGRRVVFAEGLLPTHLSCGRHGRLIIGDEVVFNYGVRLHADSEIHIGDRCMFGSLVEVVDRLRGRGAPVRIEDDVWVAHGAVIAPGVRIGRGSVISAGSVVERDVPPGSLAMGRPARIFPIDLVA
jgi:acetyltransferase-like isoleucine patch superfamily enzyme